MDKIVYFHKIHALLWEVHNIEFKKGPTNSHVSCVKKALKGFVALKVYSKHFVNSYSAIYVRFYEFIKPMFVSDLLFLILLLLFIFYALLNIR